MQIPHIESPLQGWVWADKGLVDLEMQDQKMIDFALGAEKH